MTRWSGPPVSGTEDGIDFEGRYTVTGMSGVAFWLHGWTTREIEESWLLDCTEDEHIHVESCYLYSEPEIVADHNFVRAVMVGDNREHIVDRDDLTVITEEDYCGECGQTSCGWGRPSS